MKIKVAFLVFMLCIATTASAFARGGVGYMVGQGYYRGGGHYDGYRSRSYYGGHSGRYYGHSGRYYGYPGRYYGYSGRHHYDDGLGIAVGVVGGMILGSALAYSAAPPPPTVVYGAPVAYQPQVVVQQPRVCVEERRVSGEWQISQFDGRQVWVEFAYPITQRIQVPCY
jgi:hypothetical protein